MGGGTQLGSSPAGLARSQKRPRSWGLGNATLSLAPPGKPSSAPLPSLSAACQQLMDRKLSPSSPSNIATTSPARPLLAPGSWEALPKELALGLAFTTRGKELLARWAGMLMKEQKHLPTQQEGPIFRAWGSI